MNRAITMLSAAAIAFSSLIIMLPAEAHCHHHWRGYQNMGYTGYNPGMVNPYMTQAINPYGAGAVNPYMAASPYGANPYMQPGLMQRMRYGLGF